MTTMNEAVEAIYKEWADNISLSTSNYTFENEGFDPPSRENWARLTIRHSPAGQETLGPSGGRRFERRGRVLVELFTPAPDPDGTDSGGGRYHLDVLGEEVLDLFESKRLSGTTVRFVGTSEPRERPSDGAYLSLVIELAFVYTETK